MYIHSSRADERAASLMTGGRYSAIKHLDLIVTVIYKHYGLYRPNMDTIYMLLSTSVLEYYKKTSASTLDERAAASLHRRQLSGRWILTFSWCPVSVPII